MKARLSIIGWVFLVMTGISFFGYSFIKMFAIENMMLENAFGTILMALPAVLYLIFQDVSEGKKRLRFRFLSVKAVLLLFVAAVALQMVTMEINMVTSLFFSSATTDAMMEEATQSSFVLSLICMAVMPAIFEELSFRGAFFQEFRRAYGVWGGVLISSLLFGIYHMNMRQFAHAFICGVFFAILVEITDSIESSMLLHFLMNAFSCVVMYIAANFSQEEMSDELTQQAILQEVIIFFPIALMGIGLMIVVCIGLAKVCGRMEYLKEVFSWQNISNKRRIGSEYGMQSREQCIPWKWATSIPMVVSVLLCVAVIVVIEIVG